MGAVKMRPEIRFCTTTDGIRIAFTAVGQGPPLVCLAPWFFMLEASWHQPWIQAFYQSLGEGRRLIMMDRRGVGASQREVRDVGLESGVADLAAVVEHLQFSGFSLWGEFDGAAVGALYSARHPERVHRLILLGPYATGADVYRREGVDGLIQLMRGSWPAACATMASRSFPEGPPELIPWLARAYSEGFSAEIAERYLVYASTLDASSFLPRVTAPTLVMYRHGGREPPSVANSRHFAAMIPNARLMAVATVPWLEMEPIIDAVNAFLSEGVSTAGLTKREAEVLGLLAAGKSNLEISAQLFLSLRTVERHITHIYDKLGVRNRAEATSYAVKHGIA
jgi:DNA-binding CsgD family transcriptional regulator/pimeloyl-ACP methyl ester carboxylesterase